MKTTTTSWKTWIKRSLLLLLGVILILAIVRTVLTFPELALEPLLTEELLDRPTAMIEMPQQPNKMVVIEKQGVVKWFDPQASKVGGVLLDIRDRVEAEPTEEGLLGIVYQPNYETHPYVYLYYNAVETLEMRLSRFRVDPQTGIMDPQSEKRLLALPKKSTGHNAGQLAIGPDQMLYLSIGENNYHLESKELSNLFGKIIRIDVRNPDVPKGYVVPPDNPFVNTPEALPEIWAYGLRNPWRFSFDPETGDIFTGDVGFITYEEINRVQKGKYYGWPIMEGTECYQDYPDCTKEGEMPIGSFPRMLIRVIIGGYVYQGSDFPDLHGTYVFADFFRGLYTIPKDTTDTITLPDILLHQPFSYHPLLEKERILISSMAQDSSGELYVLDMNGAIYKLVPLTLLSIFRHI